MKRIILPAFLCCTLIACNQELPATQQETATAETSVGKTYGAAFQKENVITVAQLQETVQQQDSVRAVVTAEIASSCQSKGCWMDVKLADNSTMKVTFKDYGFFLPVEDLAGKEVVFTGMARKQVISVEDQRHYAKDAGKPESEIVLITTPKEELRFVADGVMLK